MTNALAVAASPAERAERLAQVRTMMREQGIDLYIVRGTDKYLNEYVPTEESTRAWLSGFTGSVADLLISPQQAFIFVDGRYYLQADQECDAALFEVVKVKLGGSNEQYMYEQMSALVQKGARRVGYEPERFSVAEHNALVDAVGKDGVEYVAVQPSFVETARGVTKPTLRRLRSVPVEVAGLSTEEKLATLRLYLKEKRLDAIVLQALDDIAYLSNLRGDEIAFQSTFRAVAVVSHEDFVVALPGSRRDNGLELSSAIHFVAENAWITALPTAGARVGYDSGSTTEAVRAAIQRAGAEPVVTSLPLRSTKAKKNPAELRHMITSFRRADKVIWALQSWLHGKVDKGEKITEADLATETAKRFKRSGAKGLSFEVIAACGTHGAVIHYSDPDPVTGINAGDLVLLDTGAFYEGGYATDLTRTFVAGRRNVVVTERKKLLFTSVLKGAIAGMTAVFPEGTKGSQIDALCRAPLWNQGFQYLHGTGHGVGINVHEMPPRISPISDMVLEPGHVFSIEPGVYLEGEGGVRIENLATVVADPQHAGFLRVVPLTFSPLDKRLIDVSMLSKTERTFLKWFADMWKIEHDSIPEPPTFA